jgi:hypothetical protein
MPKRYAREFGRAVCERLIAGERVTLLAKELGVSEATLYLWKRQALIDADPRSRWWPRSLPLSRRLSATPTSTMPQPRRLLRSSITRAPTHPGGKERPGEEAAPKPPRPVEEGGRTGEMRSLSEIPDCGNSHDELSLSDGPMKNRGRTLGHP